jgi:L-malate glycosyltransferase
VGSLSQAPSTVLFIHWGQDWVRGSERVLLDLATSLPAARYRPVLWCDSGALRKAAAEAGLELVDRPLPPNLDVPWWRAPPDSVHEAIRVIRDTGARLLHVNTLECLPWSIRAAKAARIPVLSHLHLATTPEERIWSGLHQATMVVGVSKFSLAWVGVDGFEPAATRLIYNAVSSRRLEAGSAVGLRAELGIPREAFVAVAVGSLIPHKNMSTVIDAVVRSAKSGADIHLLVVGSGESRAQLEAEAAQSGFAGRIHFLGDREDVGAILRDAADLLISGAREETFGLNIVEAGYFGLPSIVSDILPHQEIVRDGGTGLLFPVGDSRSLADRILRLAGNPTLRKELGAGARAAVREQFSLERFLEQFTRLYEELLAFPRRRLSLLGGFRMPACYWRFGWSRLTTGFRRLVPLRV